MILCGKDCTPCCDFCIHSIRDVSCEHGFSGAPVGCCLHKEDRYQKKAKACSYCDDFHCFKAEVKK